MNLDQLEAAAKAAIGYGLSIGECAWYAPGEVASYANRNGAIAISVKDDAYIAACDPATVLALLARLRALEVVAQAAKALDGNLAPGNLEALRAALQAVEAKP